MSNRVFVVQRQLKTLGSGEVVPKHDVSAAEAFGELIYMLSPSVEPLEPAEIIATLHHHLCSYGRSTGLDYLLLLGNPCLIGWAVAIANQYSDGWVRLLQWEGSQKRYLCVAADLRVSLPL